MPVVDWGFICDSAYFDRHHRLFMFGVETGGHTVTMPVGVQRFTIVIHLRDRDPRDRIDPVIFMTRPPGDWTSAGAIRDAVVESCGDYMLLHVASVPFREEGIYRFELALSATAPTAFETSVLVTSGRPVRPCPHGAFE